MFVELKLRGFFRPLTLLFPNNSVCVCIHPMVLSNHCNNKTNENVHLQQTTIHPRKC